MSLLKYPWPRNQPLDLFLVDDGQIPFDPHLAAIQMEHVADFLRFISGGAIKIHFQGLVQSVNYHSIKDGNVYVQFRSEESNRWANAIPKPYAGSPPEGGIIYFRPEKVDTAGKFAGMFVHELFHILGAAHVETDSIMQTGPYLDYGFQGLLQLQDFETLYKIFLKWPMEYPSYWDDGKEDPDRCVIYLPRINWYGAHKAVRIYGEFNGKWGLYTGRLHMKDVAPGPALSFIQNDKIHFPLRFRGTSLNVEADIVHTNSRTEFVNVKLEQEMALAA